MADSNAVLKIRKFTTVLLNKFFLSPYFMGKIGFLKNKFISECMHLLTLEQKYERILKTAEKLFLVKDLTAFWKRYDYAIVDEGPLFI